MGNCCFCFNKTPYDSESNISLSLLGENEKITYLKASQDDLQKLTRRNTKNIFISKTNDFQLSHKVSIEDFDLVKVLGRGSFGKVMLVELKTSSWYFKIIRLAFSF